MQKPLISQTPLHVFNKIVCCDIQISMKENHNQTEKTDRSHTEDGRNNVGAQQNSGAQMNPGTQQKTGSTKKTSRIHKFPVRVYYSDTDAGGIVYHARYLDMAEHARTEYIRDLGITQHEHMTDTSCGFIVSSLSMQFHHAAVLDDLLTVETSVVSLKRFSITLDQTIKRGDEILVEIIIKVGYVSLELRRPMPLPDSWKRVMEG